MLAKALFSLTLLYVCLCKRVSWSPFGGKGSKIAPFLLGREMVYQLQKNVLRIPSPANFLIANRLELSLEIYTKLTGKL